jgi:imidazolonepropionase-like amidohydrolase
MWKIRRSLIRQSLKVSCFVLFSSTLSAGARAQDLAITGVKVYASPEAQPISAATIFIHAGKIAGVGQKVRIPAGTPALSCPDCVVFAGFWNCHVHFSEAKWIDAAHQPAGKLTGQLQEMLTNSGFTTVVDTGSDLRDTIALRRRIESGEVKGPRIYTAGTPLYPPHAIPFYLADLPAEVRAHLPQPDSPAEAMASVRSNISAGTDIVKLFTGSYVARGHVVAMPLPVARAAVEAGHQRGQLVFAHPSNLEGVRVAMQSGVDVLAHAPDTVDGVDTAVLRQLVAHHMAMAPTLKLFSGATDIARIREIVAEFHRLGGQLIFGTDTGFVTDYNLAEEYRQLSLAGLTFRDVLAMLTTAPAARFKVAADKGSVAPGMEGDLTVLSADPSAGDLTAFTHVRYTIRKGRIIAGKP